MPKKTQTDYTYGTEDLSIAVEYDHDYYIAVEYDHDYYIAVEYDHDYYIAVEYDHDMKISVVYTAISKMTSNGGTDGTQQLRLKSN